MKLEDVTFEDARYGGIYSGGQIHAWGCPATAIPYEAYADDTTCCEYWCGPKAEPVGVGKTKKTAFADLQQIIKNKGVGDRPYN